MGAHTAQTRSPFTGAAGVAVILGGAALLLVLIQFAAGPFAPQDSLGTTIVDIASDIRDAAARKLAGEPKPEPQAPPWTIDRIMVVVALVAGGAALVVAAVGLLRGESPRALAVGAGLGAGAIVFQVAVWLALLIIGAMILVSILDNLGDILPGG
ncbi:hypothetical protein [Roseospira goensis]|uniref:Uncharacterized protein n=1 Tax=Roseospira goensis TaxID=391922 RepID=A0A7W6WKI4_9PROT|nr:hypothetical protein [Roseospira goensis]MBB4286351.1 hypothetical protein [Roseospira goensis]